MRELLKNKIGRLFGDQSVSQVAVLGELKTIADVEGVSTQAAGLLARLGTFLDDLDTIGLRSDNDRHLQKIKLQISSSCLSEAQAHIRHDTESGQRALDVFRSTADSLQHMMNPEVLPLIGQSLESLSTLLSELVHQRDMDRALLQASLDESLNLRFALDQHAIVTITDASGVISYANDLFCKTSGFLVPELIGSTHQLISSGVHPKTFFAEMWRDISVGKVWRGDVCNRTKSGSLFWVSTTIVPFCDVSSVPIQYIAIRTDITAARKISEDLQHASDVAESANRAKSEFLANMSHEIRTPLSAVMGMSHLLLDTSLDSDQRQCMNLVRSSSDALLVVINDILDFSKIEAGQLQFEILPFNLVDILGDVLKTLSLSAEAKGLILVFDLHQDVPAYVMGDAGRLRQILVNLVGNAIKFTQQGEVALTVALGAVQAGLQTVQFTISDSGVGIAPASLKNIFNAFTQEDSSISRKYGGSGLGLSISLNLAKALGGGITVTSELGVGTQFCLSIPFELDPNRVAPLIDVSSLAGLNVLVVEANDLSRGVLVRLLKTAKMQVQSIASVDSAVALLRQEGAQGHFFDLMLIDANMSGLDGFASQALDKHQVQWSRIKRVLLTATGRKAEIPRWLASDCDITIAKPVAYTEMLTKLVSLMQPAPAAMPMPIPTVVKPLQQADANLPIDILLVEDNDALQILATMLLKRWGHRVTLAKDGQQALDALAQHRFDLVLMDMMMPVVDGIQATQRFRATEQGRRTPIVAMTANAMQDDLDRCISAGMDDFITKPIDIAKFQAIILKYGLGK